MSDSWEGLDTQDADYSDYLGGPQAPTPVGPLVSPLFLGNISPRPGEPTPSSPGAGGLSGLQVRRTGALGDFTPTAICELRTLSKLSYLFFVNVSTGDTMKALAVLGVYRSLFNSARHSIVTGFSSAAQAILPTTLADASWSTDMNRAVALTLSATLGASNTAVTAALQSMPSNMAQLATWFPTLRAAVGPEDTALSDYANTPTSGDYATAVGAIARDDLTSCLTPATAAPSPSPSVSAPAPGTQYVLAPSRPAQVANTTPGGSSASGPGSRAAVTGSGSGILTVLLVGLVAYGGYLAFKDSGEAGKKKLAGVDDVLLKKAHRAAAHDVTRMKCLPTAQARRQVSMDELAGPRGEKLSVELAQIPPEAAMPIEDAYFAELDRLAPGRRRCV